MAGLNGAKFGEVKLSCLNRKLLESLLAGGCPCGMGKTEEGREGKAGLCETLAAPPLPLGRLMAGSGSMMGDSAERLIMGEVMVVTGEMVLGLFWTREKAGETSALPRLEDEE